MAEYNRLNFRKWSMLGSCGSFGMAALELPDIDETTRILTADLYYYSGLERFKQKYPERIVNVGIAEQNMIGMAAGMVKEGISCFATTYATFASTRVCDQVRVNMGYMNLPIKLVGLTAGLSTGILGATHMSIEDVAIMRSIPNITIVQPADCAETFKATLAAAEFNGPVYLRLTGTQNQPMVYKDDFDFEIGKAITLREGTDTAIAATGTMVYNSLKAAEKLSEEGIECKVINMHTIKPLDIELLDSLLDYNTIFTVEEHSIIGGLSGAVAEYYASKKNKPRQIAIGIDDCYPHAADYNYLINEAGLSTEDIILRIKQNL